MGGWKTWTGAIGAILGGVGICLQALTDGDVNQIAIGWAMITGGLTAIGIGHKIEKAE